MINLNSIKNKIVSTLIIFPPVCLADEETVPKNTTGETLKLGVSGDFANLTDIAPKDFISGIIVLALNVSIITFIFIFLLGGYRWITSSGDEKKLAAARNQITHGLVGLAIVLSSWLIIGIIGTLFDINTLKWTIPSFGGPSSPNSS